MKRLADHDIKILNSLIGTTLDSADGYSQAAMSAADERHRDLFREWANDRRRVVMDLQSQMRVLGAAPDEDDLLPGGPDIDAIAEEDEDSTSS